MSSFYFIHFKYLIRCHRIGQVKPVTVYKLVAEGSVDEDIYDMGERKRLLSTAVLQDDPHSTEKSNKNNKGGKNNNGDSNKGDSNQQGDVSLISRILQKALARRAAAAVVAESKTSADDSENKQLLQPTSSISSSSNTAINTINKVNAVNSINVDQQQQINTNKSTEVMDLVSPPPK